MPRHMTIDEHMTRYEVDPATGCWNWTGTLLRSGYGRFETRRGGQREMYVAHRVSYEVHVGPIPDGLQVNHKCRSKACINPDHIYAGTQSENMRDAVHDGTHHTARRTHCPRGHELSGDNLKASQARRGWRQCLTCHREQGREQAALIKAASEHLGLTQREYITRYGQSAKTAKAILGRQP